MSILLLNTHVSFYRRRMQQLKLWQQREKEWARARAKREKSNKRSIYFSDSVMLLEAAARNDIDEGDYGLYIHTHIYTYLICLVCFYRISDSKIRTCTCSIYCISIIICQNSTKPTS